MIDLMIAGALAVGLSAAAAVMCTPNEKKVWNNGRCSRCGANWHYRHFHRTSTNIAVALDCPSCGRHEELDYFDPTDK